VALACRKGQGVGLSPRAVDDPAASPRMPVNMDHPPGIRAWGSWPKERVCKYWAELEVKPHKVRYYLEQRGSGVRAQDGRNPLCLPASGDDALPAESGESQGKTAMAGPGHRSYDEKTRDSGDRYETAPDRPHFPALARP